MWDIDIVARHRHNERLRQAAQRRQVALARAAAAQAARKPAPARAQVRARRALGFALVQAGLWVLVGRQRRLPIEQLARHQERETARASGTSRA